MHKRILMGGPVLDELDDEVVQPTLVGPGPKLVREFAVGERVRLPEGRLATISEIQARRHNWVLVRYHDDCRVFMYPWDAERMIG